MKCRNWETCENRDKDGDSVGCETHGCFESSIPSCSLSPCSQNSDKNRLDWLDEQTKQLNGICGSRYGWRFDRNMNRNAMLADHHFPVMDVRQAIDTAMGYENVGAESSVSIETGSTGKRIL